MKSRLDFHYELVRVFGKGVPLYFQAPVNVIVKYPCVVYEFADESVRFADNQRYLEKTRYKVTVITKDPDSPLFEKVKQLDYVDFSTSFVTDALHHRVYQVHY